MQLNVAEEYVIVSVKTESFNHELVKTDFKEQ